MPKKGDLISLPKRGMRPALLAALTARATLGRTQCTEGFSPIVIEGQPPPWATVDLDVVQLVHSVIIEWSSAHAPHMLFVVQGSLDGMAYYNFTTGQLGGSGRRSEVCSSRTAPL